jgi:hypothetical protein
MKRIVVTFLIFAMGQLGAQSTRDFLVGASFDLIKTDNAKLLDKAQIGLEGHYFVVRQFAVGAGAELWTTGQPSSFTMGARWYPTDKFFVRFRGLIGANDAAAGVGWSHPFKDSFRIEAIGDFYFAATEVALRIGAAYVIKPRK